MTLRRTAQSVDMYACLVPSRAEALMSSKHALCPELLETGSKSRSSVPEPAERAAGPGTGGTVSEQGCL